MSLRMLFWKGLGWRGWIGWRFFGQHGRVLQMPVWLACDVMALILEIPWCFADQASILEYHSWLQNLQAWSLYLMSLLCEDWEVSVMLKIQMWSLLSPITLFEV